jgi:hypothetical protein
MQSFRNLRWRIETKPLKKSEEENVSKNLDFDLTENPHGPDLSFEAIQISQIIALQCEVLKDEIYEGNRRTALEMVDSISKRAIHVGRMIRTLREIEEQK